MGISVGEQNVDEQAPGELLYVGSWPAGKLVKDPADLLIIGVPVFLMSVLKQDLREVFDVRSARSLSVKATHSVGVLLGGQIQRRQIVQLRYANQCVFRDVDARRLSKRHGGKFIQRYKGVTR